MMKCPRDYVQPLSDHTNSICVYLLIISGKYVYLVFLSIEVKLWLILDRFTYFKTQFIYTETINYLGYKLKLWNHKKRNVHLSQS